MCVLPLGLFIYINYEIIWIYEKELYSTLCFLVLVLCKKAFPLLLLPFQRGFSASSLSILLDLNQAPMYWHILCYLSFLPIHGLRHIGISSLAATLFCSVKNSQDFCLLHTISIKKCDSQQVNFHAICFCFVLPNLGINQATSRLTSWKNEIERRHIKQFNAAAVRFLCCNCNIGV